MNAWTAEQLDEIGTSEELEISTARPDGSYRPFVPIWVVRWGDDVYVRSYRGPDGSWYRHVGRDGRARIRVAVDEYDVAAEPVNDGGEVEQIDRAYQRKYSRYGDRFVRPMLAEPARSTTLRLTPRGGNGASRGRNP